MTDFKGFNPDKNLSANFNSKKQTNKAKGQAQPEPTPQAGDPYADLKMDPERMLELLNNQAKFSSAGRIEQPGIEKAVNTFNGAISPERHAQVSSLMKETFQKEFGMPPSSALLQDMVDDYLIGHIAIQAG